VCARRCAHSAVSSRRDRNADKKHMSSPLLRYVPLSRSLCRCSTSFDIRRRSGSLRPPRLVSRVATALGIHSTRANPQRSVRPLHPLFSARIYPSRRFRGQRAFVERVSILAFALSRPTRDSAVSRNKRSPPHPPPSPRRAIHCPYKRDIT